MKAFEVHYETADHVSNIVVLVEYDGGIENAVHEKSRYEYELDSQYCKIIDYNEIPLSQVTISELSIIEFLKLSAYKGRL